VLARASVGFAMSGGTSLAMDTGDIVLCKDDLSGIIMALDLSRAGLLRVKVNYLWAAIYICCLANSFFKICHLCCQPAQMCVFVPYVGVFVFHVCVL